MLDAEASQRFLNQVFELWVNPEIQKRKLAGQLTSGFRLVAAQVVMNVGQPVVVRLNGEVRAIMFARRVQEARSEPRVGDPVYWNELGEVTQVVLTELDPNAAHVTLLVRPDGACHLSCDFRYNAARVKQLTSAAREFWDTAKYAARRGHRRAFLENLFAAAELTAKAQLTLLPDDEILTSRKHGIIASKINLHRSLGNVDAAVVDLFNRLGAMRGLARYVQGDVPFSPMEMRRMLAHVGLWLRHVDRSVPKRLPLRAA